MVIFHSYVSLPEGNLALTISVVSGRKRRAKSTSISETTNQPGMKPNSRSKPSVNVGTPIAGWFLLMLQKLDHPKKK